MVNGRQKGAAAEREIAKLLFDELGLSFKRDLEQYRAADHGDLICDEPFPFCIEVKRYRPAARRNPRGGIKCAPHRSLPGCSRCWSTNTIISSGSGACQPRR